ncbi:hypothetical protein BsWGS_22035 [Bradybaena similaris]
MEQESRNRRRRSLRHLRRSSSFYTDSFTPSFEVDDFKADCCDVDLVSTYGSIWLQDEKIMKDTNSLVACVSDRANHVEHESIACKNNCEQQTSSHPSCEFSEGSFCAGDFLRDHQSLLGGSAGAQYVANTMEPAFVDVTSLSFCESGCDSVARLQTPSLSKVHLDVDMNCGEESCPQMTHVPSFHISNNLQKSMNAADEHFMQENLNLSYDGKVCDFDNKRLHENVCHVEGMLEENTQSSSEVVKTVLTDEVIRNVLTEKLQNSLNVNEPCDDLIAVSLKERRKGGRLNERPDAVKDSDFKPKKRKRLSLNKIPSYSAELVHNDVNRDVETNSDTKISIVVENEKNIETVEKVNNTHNLNTDNMNSTSASECIDANKWSEKLDLMNCIDHVTSKEVDFEKDFFFQDFSVPSCEVKSKRSSQAKAKAARRSSRLFNAYEMPLNDLSLEPDAVLDLTPSRISKKEFNTCEANSSVSVTCSPDVSARRSRFSENKENVSAMKVCTIGKMHKHEEESSTKYLLSAGTDQMSVKGSTSVEEVVEDFANLYMNEETLTECSSIVHDVWQATWRSGSTIVSDAVDITRTNIHGCTSTDGNTSDIQNLHPHVDTSSPYNNLLDTSTLQENVESDREMSFHPLKFAVVYEEENSDSMEDQQSTLDTAFSAPSPNPSADVDMEELLSPDKKCGEQETYASVVSESGKCMRLRRGRKSWDTNQQLNPDARKKPVRRKSKQISAEELTNKLVGSDDTKTPVDAAMAEQPDNDSEENAISPGLLCLYQNKNFVAPQPRSWETIRESPRSSQLPVTKQRHKCFLEFENGNTYAKQQRRKKKALNVYKKIGGPAPTLSMKEFEQRMLDVQLFIDS